MIRCTGGLIDTVEITRRRRVPMARVDVLYRSSRTADRVMEEFERLAFETGHGDDPWHRVLLISAEFGKFLRSWAAEWNESILPEAGRVGCALGRCVTPAGRIWLPLTDPNLGWSRRLNGLTIHAISTWLPGMAYRPLVKRDTAFVDGLWSEVELLTEAGFGFDDARDHALLVGV